MIDPSQLCSQQGRNRPGKGNNPAKMFTINTCSRSPPIPITGKIQLFSNDQHFFIYLLISVHFCLVFPSHDPATSSTLYFFLLFSYYLSMIF